MFWGKINEISRVVREIPVGEIAVPRDRARTGEDDEALRRLTESVRRHGVIEPLLVRRTAEARADEGAGSPADTGKPTPSCVLVAGERRLRAAVRAGMHAVPCVFTEADDADAAVLAIVENLHREDLNLFESASAVSSLLSLTGMTQEQCARRLGVSQSYVANKLRLLRLTEDERRAALENGLTERHCRALLRLEDGEDRKAVLSAMISRRMNVAQAEEYVESMLCAQARAEKLRHTRGGANGAGDDARRRLLVRDTRQFFGSIDRAVDVMRRTGIAVEASRRDTAEGTLISILLPKSS
ncbi:MAG: ParB/RepB/Spo0J family partition protein [Clostridia bacterium]|nr:ParB/RepB/Spo0J family partition protein [Clostridia bacterium]